MIGDRLEYKVTGLYSQAEDWSLDPNNPHDQEQIETYFRDIPREDDAQRGFVSGMLSYRLAPNTSLTANGGWATTTSTFLSRIGTLQADNFGYSFGQLRFRSGDFFAQAYLNQNHAGDSFVYASQAASLTGATVVDESTLFKTEAQQNLDLLDDRLSLTMGADFEQITPSTDGTITGRNEGDDRIQFFGVYAQSETALTDQLALTLATRPDYDNIFETVQLSPRAGLIYKPMPCTPSGPRTTGRSRSPRSTPSSSTSPHKSRRWLRGRLSPSSCRHGERAAASGSTRSARPARLRSCFRCRALSANRWLSMRCPSPPSTAPRPADSCRPFALGKACPTPSRPCRLPRATPLPTCSVIRRSKALSGPQRPGPCSWASPTDDSDRGYRTVSGPVDTQALDQTITQTFELGYKGVVGERVALAVDGYYARKTDFVGTLAVETPFAYLQQNGLSQDVGAALGQFFATTTDPTVQQLLNALNGQGLPPSQVTQLLAGLTGGALADTPAAVVQPDEAVLPSGTSNTVGGLLTYRNFGTVNVFGLDAAAQVQATDRWSLFGNVSLVSDNYFDNDELDEQSPDLSLSLNAPRFKTRIGTTYQIPQGLSVNLAGRYTEGYRVESGPYIGTIDDAFVLDAGIGYDFARTLPGLRLNVTVQNALDNDHRQFIGAPKIGRLAIARLTYTL